MKLRCLEGRRILVVEDNMLLALTFEQLLKDAGADVIGPAATIAEARNLTETNNISAALLDVQLADGEVWPVAQLLASKGVPFAFCTGYYDLGSLATQWPGRPVVSKCAIQMRILAILTELLMTPYHALRCA